MKHNSQMSQTQAVTQAYVLTLIARTDEQIDRCVFHSNPLVIPPAIPSAITIQTGHM